MRSRHGDIAAYFAVNATALERTVARHVVASAIDGCSRRGGTFLHEPRAVPQVRLALRGRGRNAARHQFQPLRDVELRRSS